MTLKEILIAGKLTVSEGGGGGDTLGQYLSDTLETYANDSLTSLWGYAFAYAKNLKQVSFPNLVEVKGYAFTETGITTLVLPAYCKGKTWTEFNAFSGMRNLEALDVHGHGAGLRNQWASGCSKLETVIIRSPTLMAASAQGILANTPFNVGSTGGTGGTLYVPQALIESYQSAANWSTILSYPNNQILPIEGSIYETQYADGTPIA